jgi:aspartate/glutamate racemase
MGTDWTSPSRPLRLALTFLGCTELTLLISQEDCPVHVFDTARIHAEGAADYMLNNA